MPELNKIMMEFSRESEKMNIMTVILYFTFQNVILTL